MEDTNKKVQDLRSLLDISRAMTAEQDLDRLLDLIMDRTTELLNAERSTLFLYDEASDELYSRIAQKSEVEEIRVEMGEGIAGSVAQDRKIINIRDAYEDDRFNADVDKETGFRTRSILCAPLINQTGDLIGVVQVLNKEGGPFTDYDEELLEGLSANAAVALENARLFEHFREKQKIKQSLNIARQIQQNLLPDAAPDLASYQIEGFSKPAEETGGDYFDYFRLPDDRIGVLIIDVTGHGIGPAILMAIVRSVFHALVQEQADPADILTRANEMLFEDMGDERFATGCLIVLDPETGEFSYANAGHDPPFFVPAAAAEKVELIESTGVPLGIVEGFEYGKEGPFQLEPGGEIVLYTDGFTETMNEDGEIFGEDRLREFVLANQSRSPRDFIQVLEEQVKEYRGDQPRDDDLTLVVVKRDQEQPPS